MPETYLLCEKYPPLEVLVSGTLDSFEFPKAEEVMITE